MSELLFDTVLNISVFIFLVTSQLLVTPSPFNNNISIIPRWVLFIGCTTLAVGLSILLFREIEFHDFKLFILYGNPQVFVQVALYFWGPVFGSVVALSWAVTRIIKHRKYYTE